LHGGVLIAAACSSNTCRQWVVSATIVQPIGAACAHLSPLQLALGKPPTSLSLLFSLSASRDFSDVAMLPAYLAVSIILALRRYRSLLPLAIG